MKGFCWFLLPVLIALLLAVWWDWQQGDKRLLPLGLGIC